VKRAALIAAAVLVSGALFWAAMRGVDVAELGRVFAGASLAWAPALVIAPILDLWVRAARWRLLLAPMARASVRDLFQLEALGLAINNVLFLRLGEFARGFFAAKETRIPAVSVLATILVERLCDTAALLLLFSVGVGLLPRGTVPGAACLMAAGGCAALCAVLALLAWADRDGEGGAVARALGRFPRLRLWSIEIMAGARSLRDAPSAWAIAWLSLALWIVDAGGFWAAGRALRLAPPLSAPQSLAVVAFAAAASALPAMPGAFGNYEASVRYVVMRFGHGKPAAVAFAVLSHLSTYVVVTAIGIGSLYALGHTLSGLRQTLKR
jgi:uncharacterized membrane protein YbhN (UPF0104 family)